MPAMENPGMISVLLAVNLARSLFFCSMAAFLVGFRQFCAKSMVFLLTQIKFVSSVGTPGETHGGEVAVSPRRNCCSSCKRSLLLSPAVYRRHGRAMDGGREAPTGVDIELVMDRLGMRVDEEGEAAQEDGRCRDCFLVEVAEGVMEEKEASAEELAAAFSVFDRDGDGFIGPEELRDVMWRLGLEEGMEVDGCRRMIQAFDEDGDGTIDLAEFRKLLESTT